jgi:hypothetical protein
VVGIVAAGREADRRGPAAPFVAGVVLFGCGLAVAGSAPSGKPRRFRTAETVFS